MTVKTLAMEFSLWESIVTAVENRLAPAKATQLLEVVGSIPVRRSRATRTLGVYVSKPAGPVCVRLQFAQEPESLRDTFLHEVAHAFDHLCHQSGKAYRRGHGPNWQAWAEAFSIAPERCGKSEQLEKLYSQRLKVVAICRSCGAELRRLRRLNQRRRYIHTDCGGRLKLL